MKVNGNAKEAALKYAEKHLCRQDGTRYRLTMYSADDGGREWAQLKSYNGYTLLFERRN